MIPISQLIVEAQDCSAIRFGIEGKPIGVGELLARSSLLVSSAAASEAVAAILTNDRPSVEIIMATIVQGARLVSLPLPARGADLAEYVRFLAKVIHRYGAKEIIARDDLAEILAASGLPSRGHKQLWSQPVCIAADAGFELIQFTSGSTQDPKAVRLSDDTIGTNVAAIVEAVRPRRGDVAVSWLPLSHDMGLIGMLLASVASAGNAIAGRTRLVLLEPESFLREPGIWMESVSRHRGTFTAAPDFGFRLASRAGLLAQGHLATLRVAIVGGEIVRAETLQTFVSAHEAAGLNALSICPAYGMAEFGLCVAMTPPDVLWRETQRSEKPAPNSVNDAPSTSSGLPLLGYAVRTTGQSGSTAKPLEISGPAIGVDERVGRPFASPGGWYRPGDVGFIDGGWVYICGRNDDYATVNGRNVFLPAIEGAVGNVVGVRAGRVATFGLESGEWIVVAERTDSKSLDRVATVRLKLDIRRAVVGACGIGPSAIEIVDKGSIPVTPSGKLRRNHAKQLWVDGRFPS